MAEPIGEELNLISRLTGPIHDLSPMRRSLLFAELANLSYYADVIVVPVATQVGLPHCKFFERDGAQVYLLWNDHDVIVCCRGTESNDWNDLKADVNAAIVATETLGRIHGGFNREVDDIWPSLEESLRQHRLPTWFCGHSLGGAMATICAGRCVVSTVTESPKGLFTFGSPRVGDRQFIKYVKLEHTRWVNNNDIVTRVPPVWMGYRHGGREMYIDSNGRLRSLAGWARTKDRLRGFLLGLRRFKIDQLSDHSMERYIETIRAEVVKLEEKSGLRAAGNA